MMDYLSKLFETADFPARWTCGHWTAGHGWLHILSDIAIFGAYAAIPAVLVYFVLRRKDIPFPPIFWLFAAFILFCGMGHLIESTLFWHPWYRLSGLFKLATALISWVTVVALIQVTPKALALPGLARLSTELQAENQQRAHAQRLLQQSRDDLERRVLERTEDLTRSNLLLQQKSDESDRFNKLAVGREERMIELKREVNALSRALGRSAPYDLPVTDLEGM